MNYSRGSSWSRDQTHVSCVSCIGRWILYHWATWENLLQVSKFWCAPELSTQTSLCTISVVKSQIQLVWGWGDESKHEVPQSCPSLCDHMDCSPRGSSIHGIFLGKSTGGGCIFLLQRVFLTQGSNLGLPHCKQMLFTIWAMREAPKKESEVY